MAYGLQIYDASGNLILDTTTLTVKDFGTYEISSVTSDQTINTGTSNLPTEVEALVINNTGDDDTSDLLPSVTLDRTAGTITVAASGGGSYNVGIKLMALE